MTTEEDQRKHDLTMQNLANEMGVSLEFLKDTQGAELNTDFAAQVMKNNELLRQQSWPTTTIGPKSIAEASTLVTLDSCAMLKDLPTYTIQNTRDPIPSEIPRLFKVKPGINSNRNKKHSTRKKRGKK